MALPSQASHCDITTHGNVFASNGSWGHNPLVRGFTPLKPQLKGMMNMKKRTHEIKIRLSQAELDALNAQVGKTRLSREQFCRNAIRGITIRENPPADLHKLIWEIRRVGNNIDQILTIANAKGLLDVPHLRQSISDLRKVEKLIAATYEQPR